MAEVDLNEFNNINKKIDNAAMEYIRKRGLLNPKNSLATYKEMFSEYSRHDYLNNYRAMQFGILHHQMKSMIEDLSAKISELETQKVLLENDLAPNSDAIKKIDDKLGQAQELLSISVARFEKFSKTKVEDKEVGEIVARYKAHCLEDRIYSRTINKKMMPSVYISDEFPSNMISKYQEYQNQFDNINKNEKGLKKYFNYMQFLREKDDKARSNWYLVRQFEKAYAGSPILENPSYQKGKNTKLDMSRYYAYLRLTTDLPMKDYEIDEFILKSHVKDNKEIER